jgi:hypothetical protein
MKVQKGQRKGIKDEDTKQIAIRWIAMGFSTQYYLNTTLLILSRNIVE